MVVLSIQKARRLRDCLFNSRSSQRGVAAIEAAFVMPLVLLLVYGIATFATALYTQQLLYDLAGEVARTCVLKDLGQEAAYISCVQEAGSFMTKPGVLHPRVCDGDSVNFTASVPIQNGIKGFASSTGQLTLKALQVTASCSTSPGFGPVPGLSKLSGIATMPMLVWSKF